ncbi:MAG TPA: DUF6599 family protein [Acidobacteriota bacterium]|nr:DUF6599 family protein [Acidobacteriota bacterium]
MKLFPLGGIKPLIRMTYDWKHLPGAAALLVLVGALPSALAFPQDALLEGLDGYRVERLTSAAVLEGVPQTVLDEYTVRDSSDWLLNPSDGGAEIEVKLFRMLDAPGAFGLLSYYQKVSGGPQDRLPDLSVRHAFGGRSLALAMGSVFALLRVPADELSPREQLAPAARALSQALKEKSVDPVTVINLPRQDLIAGSVSFYLGAAGLDSDPFFPDPLIPVLGLQEGVEVTTARYKDGGLVLVGYPTPSLARAAESRLLDSALTAGLSLKRSGILVGLASGSNAEGILDQVSYDPLVRWVEEKEPAPPITFESEMKLVTGIFANWVLFTIVFILVASALGGVIGASRYFYNRAHPERFEKGGMIRLDLIER